MPQETHTERVAGAVRAELARQRKTHEYVAGVLGVSRPTVSVRLSGRVPFDVAQLARLAEALDVPVSVFQPSEPAEVA